MAFAAEVFFFLAFYEELDAVDGRKGCGGVDKLHELAVVAFYAVGVYFEIVVKIKVGNAVGYAGTKQLCAIWN